MSEIEKSLKEQLESVINENQKLLEKHFQQDNKIVKLIEENNYYKIKLQQKENIIKEVREYIEHENFKRRILVGVSTKKYTGDMLNKILEILDKDIMKKSDCNYEKAEKENK